jgi:hypothetical protein
VRLQGEIRKEEYREIQFEGPAAMKKLLFRTMLLALLLLSPLPTMAGVDVSISLPPLIVFSAPPAMVVIPETYVYVVPDTEVEIFFYDGWWWRPWEGRWYRSRHYDSGWGYYRRVPSFYARVPGSWRNDYREHRWGGRPWNHQPIPHQQVERNWSSWKKNKHWEKQQTWGVQGLKPRSQQPSKAVQPKSQAKPQQSHPQSGEVQPQHSNPQQREAAPQPSKPAQGKPEKAQGKPDKGQGKPDKGQGKPDKGHEERR